MTALNKQAQQLRATAEKANEHGEFNMAMHTVQVLALVEALEKAHRQIAQVTAERDALREGEIGNAKHSNTRAAADIYFQLAEECDIPAGGSLVEFVDGLKERLCVLESRTVTVKLPEEFSDDEALLQEIEFCDDVSTDIQTAQWLKELRRRRTAGIQVIEGEQKNG